MKDTPFDRETTSMGAFAQCPACLEEYTGPANRRFHSQTNSCPSCGPRLVHEAPLGAPMSSGDPVVAAITDLIRGATVAIHGIGGFHLAVDPSRPGNLRKLRGDKRRARKPFALMVRDLEVARRLCGIRAEDEDILTSPQSPILILPRDTVQGFLSDVSDTATLGIMLPYTPLHLLLFRHPQVDIPYDCLVMTSGNVRDEPIITDPAQARDRLPGLADAMLSHNRPILFRTDDSVLRPALRAHDPCCIIRRSRGIVPHLVRLAQPVPAPILAVGGDIKSSPALAVGRDVYLSPYNGDLDNPATRDAFTLQIRKILDLYGVRPQRIVCDMHPLYHSSTWAREAAGTRVIEVQHHHAHILSVMAEHGLDEVLGMAFDGTGYGTDATIWGGEFLHAKRGSFSRLGNVAPFSLPGGEAAVRNPGRITAALLPVEDRRAWSRRGLVTRQETEIVDQMLEGQINCPQTTSMGRVFDAAAAALGIVRRTTYEGEGPIRMEGLAINALRHGATGDPDPDLDEIVPIRDSGDGFVLDTVPLIRTLAIGPDDRSVPEASLHFHRSIARACENAAIRMGASTGISRIALSGGVFQNMLLRHLLIPRLKAQGFTVYLNLDIPAGDGGVAVGQAYYSPPPESGTLAG